MVLRPMRESLGLNSLLTRVEFFTTEASDSTSPSSKRGSQVALKLESTGPKLDLLQRQTGPLNLPHLSVGSRLKSPT